MGWAVAELVTDPRHRDTIRREVDDIGADRTLTVDQLRQLAYTNAFVTEILRLHPPAPSRSSRWSPDPLSIHSRTWRHHWCSERSSTAQAQKPAIHRRAGSNHWANPTSASHPWTTSWSPGSAAGVIESEQR